MAESLTITVEDGIATLVLDVRGKSMNVVTPELRAELSAAISRIADDPAIKGAVLTSAKKDFMAGGDLKAMLARFEERKTATEIHEHSRLFGDIIRRLETCGKPFVAAINGLALGGGFELCLACHHRIVADGPKILLGLPEATLGLMPGAGGTQRVSRMIGAAAALPLLLSGRTMSPAEALGLGLVDAVVPPGELVAAARAWIEEAGDPVQRWEKKDWIVPGGVRLGDATLGPLYNMTVTGIARDTQRNRPSPVAIVRAVARGLPLPIDAGLRVERREFVQLMQSPTTRNIIRTQFVSKGEIEKLARRSRDIPTRDFGRIAVVGAGLMGSGIAQVAALSGLDVVLLDSSQANADKGLDRIGATFDNLVGRGKMSADKAGAALARITAASDYAAIAGAEAVIEAVFEDRDVKLAVLSAACAALGDDALYATNTSTIPVSSLAHAIGRPEQLVGMHFFSPVDRMALVEVVKGERTSARTIAEVLDLARKLRKVPIVVNDSRGFFTTRVFSSYLAESMGMLAEGINPALIENGARQAGFAMSPLALVDEVTIELSFAAANQARRDLGDAWTPSPAYPVQQMFAETLGRRGRRHGAGFYDYPENGPKRLWPGIADLYPRQPTQPDVSDIRKRMLYIQSLEAVRCLEQGIIEDVSEGDVGSVLGIGFPAYTGGVFSLIDTVGLREFVATCDRFAETIGERWRPTAGLRRRAERGEAFYPPLGAAA